MINHPLKVGLIGAGWWAAEAHLPALAKHQHARTAAIQTRSADKARKLTEQFGIPHVFTTA